MTNDFEPVVRAAYPEVDAALRALELAGAPGRPMLSGSGGACFALCPGEAEGRALAGRLRAPGRTRVEVVPFAAGATWR